MGFWPTFIGIRAEVLKMMSSPICTPMYNIRQSMTMPYKPHGNSIYGRFNCTWPDLIKTLAKEQNENWLLHIPSLVFTYNVMPHSITGFQPYELMFGCKAATVCNTWVWLASYNNKASTSKCAWLNDQHELLMSANR